MKDCNIIRKSKLIFLTKTPSTSSSMRCTPDSKSQKRSSVLRRSLQIKQELLASNLILYSQTLTEKVPATAQSLEKVDQRYNLLRKHKTIIASMIKLHKYNREQEKVTKGLESNVLRLEKENNEERSELEKKYFELQALKRKHEGLEIIKHKEAYINIDITTLSRSLQEIRKNKNVIKLNLERCKNEQAGVCKEYEECLINSENNRQSQENLKNLRDDALMFGPRNSENKIGDDLQYLYVLEEDLEYLKKKYHDFRQRNIKYSQEIKAQHEKIKAKLALIQLESRYIDGQRKKFLKIQAVFNEMNHKLSTKIAEAKKIAIASQANIVSRRKNFKLK